MVLSTATRGVSFALRRSLLPKVKEIVRPMAIQQIWFSSYPPHELVGLPSLSPTMESGSIASWHVKEGDTFAPGDALCAIETDKATIDFEAQDEGVVAKILAEAPTGDLPCGHPILVTVEEEDDVAAFADYVAEAAPAEASAPPPAAAPVAAPPAPAPVSPAPVAAAPAASSDGRVLASPLAHMLAKEMGYTIESIAGTGPGGRVIAADVKEFVPAAAEAIATDEAAAAGGEPMLAGPPIPGAGYTDYPLSATAQQLAARYAQSKRNVPHYYLTVDIDMSKLLEIRSTLNVSLEEPLGVYELLLKASAVAMKAVPSVNASWMDSSVRVYDSVDINVVMGSGDSLYTPVLRGCGTKGIKGISDDLASAMSSLEEAEENEQIPPPSEMGTFTVMNVGMYGIKSFAPIIREPQACALALGALENRIVPNDDLDSEEIYKQSVVMTATLSCDHRVVDGAVGAQWLSAFKSYVENPATLLL